MVNIWKQILLMHWSCWQEKVDPLSLVGDELSQVAS